MSNKSKYVPIEKRSFQEFSDYYLRELKVVLEGFSKIFLWGVRLYMLQLALGLFFLLIVFIYESATKGIGYGLLTIIPALLLVINIYVFFRLLSLSKDFIRLQLEKVENNIYSTAEFRNNAISLSKKILTRAKQSVQNRITVTGGNAVFALNGGRISGVDQSLSFEGNRETVRSLALLYTYCEESVNQEATDLAVKASEEATKENVNKVLLQSYWIQITKVLPEILEAKEIVDGIEALYS